jgi:UPF0755 protein
MKKTWILALSLFLIVMTFKEVYLLKKPVIEASPGVVYDLRAGLSKQAVIQQLYQKGYIHHPVILTVYAYLPPQKQIKTGEYLLPKNASMQEIWNQLVSGRGLYYRKFTIVPGWSFTQLRQLIAQTPQLKQTVASMKDAEVMAKLGHPELSPEGEFLPETYFYTKGNQDFTILKTAFTLMQNKLAAAWEKRNPNLPYKTPYEALIAASLVEKEVFLDSERPMIAGVIMNRLNNNMLLQIDSTIIFGLGDKYSGMITREDLTTDTPYNTYTRKGLPPTPIGMTGASTIEAIMHPTIHDYYYFVAQGNGSHQFSKSLVEHHEAVVRANAAKKKIILNERMLRDYLNTHMWQAMA